MFDRDEREPTKTPMTMLRLDEREVDGDSERDDDALNDSDADRENSSYTHLVDQAWNERRVSVW
jgi:hypothetical protein